MEELMSGFVAKAGLSEAQSRQRVSFLKSAIADTLPGGLGGLFGAD